MEVTMEVIVSKATTLDAVEVEYLQGLEDRVQETEQLKQWREELEDKDVELHNREAALEAREEKSDVKKLRRRLRERGALLKSTERAAITLRNEYDSLLQTAQVLTIQLENSKKSNPTMNTDLFSALLRLSALADRWKSAYDIALTEEDEQSLAAANAALQAMLTPAEENQPA